MCSASFCGPGAVMVDGGANIGTHALAVSTMVGREALVLASEPQRTISFDLSGLPEITDPVSWPFAV